MKPGHRADCSCCLFWFEEKDETPIDTTPTPVICERCGVTMEWGMFPWCKGSPADHGSGLKQHIFSPVEVDLGKEGKVVLSSVMDARRLERESENVPPTVKVSRSSSEPSLKIEATTTATPLEKTHRSQLEK